MTQKIHPCTGVALHLWKHNSFVDSGAEEAARESHHMHNPIQPHTGSESFPECPSMWLYSHVCENHSSQHESHKRSLTGLIDLAELRDSAYNPTQLSVVFPAGLHSNAMLAPLHRALQRAILSPRTPAEPSLPHTLHCHVYLRILQTTSVDQ